MVGLELWTLEGVRVGFDGLRVGAVVGIVVVGAVAGFVEVGLLVVGFDEGELVVGLLVVGFDEGKLVVGLTEGFKVSPTRVGARVGIWVGMVVGLLVGEQMVLSKW